MAKNYFQSNSIGLLCLSVHTHIHTCMVLHTLCSLFFSHLFRRYVLLEIRLITFANDKDFIGHIRDEMAYTHMSVYSLKQLVKQKADIASTQITLFRDPTSNSRHSVLDETLTLEESGLKGGPFDRPKEYCIYYDYATSFHFDPLMSSDFYFIDRPRNTTSTTTIKSNNQI